MEPQLLFLHWSRSFQQVRPGPVRATGPCPCVSNCHCRRSPSLGQATTASICYSSHPAKTCDWAAEKGPRGKRGPPRGGTCWVGTGTGSGRGSWGPPALSQVARNARKSACAGGSVHSQSSRHHRWSCRSTLAASGGAPLGGRWCRPRSACRRSSGAGHSPAGAGTPGPLQRDRGTVS